MTRTRTDTYTAYSRADGSPVPFPVEWADPDDARLVWPWASDHYPLPTTPLAVDLNKDSIGMTKSYAYFGSYTRIKYIHHQGYGFGPLTFLPETGDSPDFQRNVSAAAPNIRQLWFDTWWPLIERESRELRAADFSGLSLRQLVARLHEAADRYEYHYQLMMRASRMVRPPRAALVAFLGEHFEEDSEELATALLSGVDNVSLDASGGLWEVAQQLRGRTGLLEALAAPEKLRILPGGSEFWNSFHAWLDRYGHRNSTFEEVAEPSWMEDPTVPLSLVRAHATVATADPRAEHRLAIGRREELQRSLEARLPDSTGVTRFRELVDLALPYGSVRESRPFASCISRTAQRVPALAVGRSLVEHGLVEQPDDVFYLHLAELDNIAAQDERAASQHGLVAARRAANAFWRTIVPPLAIGAVGEGGLPPAWTGKGVPASAGIAQGRARVILDLKDAHSFQAGEVLVTVSTSPLWTALFGLASAIVTDSGGMLSHPSIVAREHRIPAVVGARGSSQHIRTGDKLLVNGTTGAVEVLS